MFWASTMLTFGERATKSATLFTRASAISVDDSTVVLIGTSMTFSARIRAVTTISSRPLASVSASAAMAEAEDKVSAVATAPATRNRAPRGRSEESRTMVLTPIQ